ncbi:hypothetical protein PVAP13_9NG494400 [Panicum virgatum]|uniref:Uncharacterized protein n=1 Tax=Panicum virgatum TaxID=38727 RepID=A0A8T0MRD8_PANVG|nr:hypothetical protein PVAP13_9NG494400 [Panicum virgatum]
MRIFFRVRLYLDGIPDHAWTPDIVERVIGSRCALQCINTDLVQGNDMRHIDLWAWTANPSDIPKRVCLVFTHRPSDKSSAPPSVFVVTRERNLQERWQQGIRYEVFLHIGLVEDYSAAATDLHGAVANSAAFTPIWRSYVWRYGLVDRAPAEARSRFPVRLPQPPRERGRDGRLREIGGKEQGGNSKSAKPWRHTAGQSCKEGSFVWPRNRNDNGDDSSDDYYAHPGQGGCGHVRQDREVVRRERTHSPRLRDIEFRGGRRRADQVGSQRRTPPLCTPTRANLGGFSPSLPNMQELRTKLQAELQALFKATADGLKHGMTALLGDKHDALIHGTMDYINKASLLAECLGIDGSTSPAPLHVVAGNVAWSVASESLIPAQRVFDRINAATVPTVTEVEQALRLMEIQVATATAATTAPELQLPLAVEGPAAGPSTPTGGESLSTMLGREGICLACNESTTPPHHCDTTAATGLSTPTAGLSTVATPPQVVPVTHGLQGTQANDVHGNDAVDSLFSTPAPAILQVLPGKPARQRRTFDMTNVRRSAKLAKKPAMPAVERA